MRKVNRALMWAALFLILVLFVFSVAGAFVGAQRAQRFFNSLPLSFFWILLAAVLVGGFAIFPRLVRVRTLLLVHAGCVLILLGGMAGSEAGHKLQKALFGIDKIKSGQMVIYEGYSENRLVVATGEQTENFSFVLNERGHVDYYSREDRKLVPLGYEELPFSIELGDFRLEYYKPGRLTIHARDDQRWTMPVGVGSELALGPELGTVAIIRTFERFRFIIEDDHREAVEASEGSLNPAVEISIEYPDGSTTTRYVFERFPGHRHTDDKLAFSYSRTISDYISDLKVIADSRAVKEKSIEVNKPLKYGGYHFYQSDYDAEGGQYTVLQVVSDTGLYTVYGGYILLCIGVFGHLWFKPVFEREKVKSE